MSKAFWIASYPRSGNTWLRAFLSNFLYPTEQPADINSLPLKIDSSDRAIFDNLTGLESTNLTSDEIDMYRPKAYRSLIHSSRETLYIKTHDAYLLLPDGTPLIPTDVTIGALYLVRSPLDVAVSFAHHQNWTIDETIENMAHAQFALADSSNRLHKNLRQRMLSWSEHISSWLDQKAFPVHMIRYEDMLSRPLETFGACTTFLGFDYDLARIRRALEQSTFETLRKQEDKNGFRERPSASAVFFRSGTAGQGGKLLSEKQINRITDNHRDALATLGYVLAGASGEGK